MKQFASTYTNVIIKINTIRTLTLIVLHLASSEYWKICTINITDRTRLSMVRAAGLGINVI